MNESSDAWMAELVNEYKSKNMNILCMLSVLAFFEEKNFTNVDILPEPIKLLKAIDAINPAALNRLSLQAFRRMTT